MAATEEEVTEMQGAIKGIQEQLVIINQRMADFVEHSKMDELTNKIEEERTDAADTRTRLADEVIKMKDGISDFKKSPRTTRTRSAPWSSRTTSSRTGSR